MPVPIACVDAGVDYITCTFNAEAEHDKLQLFLSRLKRKEERRGERLRRWSLMGYEGESCGGLEWGERHDGVIVRLSGFTAQTWWSKVARLATNCSRLDLQETMVYDEHWSKTTFRHWKEMRKWYKAGKRRPKPKEIGGPSGIETIYSGERVSARWLRLYHRGSRPKCNQFEGHVRYEAELKDDLACAALRDLQSAGDRAAWNRSSVWTMFQSRGCRLSWQDTVMSRIRGATKITDVDSALAWLEKGVSPTVRWLIESGHGDQVHKALGFPPMVQLDQNEDN